VGHTLLDGLDAQQREAVVSEAAPLAIVAPAGSGKTRVLTRRIAYRIAEGTADARRVLALTFTRKAAGELVDRLHRLGIAGPVTAGTFHAIALAELRRRAIERGHEPPRVLDRKLQLVARVLETQQATVGAADVASEIEWAKARCIDPDAYARAAVAAGRRPPAPPDAVANLYAAYERERRTRRLLDFDDLLRLCADGIVDDPDFGAGEHWRFRHFFVDEFQDATPLQLALLRAWVGDRSDLCVVGDPAQSIYAFAGADASPLRNFATTFPGGDTVVLRRNYRSAEPIVALGEVALGTAAGDRVAPDAVRGPGDPPVIVAYDTSEGEAAAVAGLCRRAFTRGVAWADMAILYRTNAQARVFEAALARRGIPSHVAEVGRFTADADTRAVLEPLRVLERESPRPFSELLSDLAADESLTTPELRAQRDLVLQLGRKYVDTETNGSVAGFGAWLDLAARAEATAPDGVTLATFHRAKGLEWPVVFVTGLERGFVPISWAATTEARAEECRLLHVALTRAEDELHCSWSRNREMGARRVAREPSPYLARLEQTAAAYRGRARSHHEHLDDLRSTLRASTPVAPRRRR
jgi:DNA helicase-2/ATP-dependent DNA helicase PcrA